MPLPLRLLAVLGLCSALLAGQQAPLVPPGQPKQPNTQPAKRTKWPIKDELFVARNFRFNTGETLPELKLHYLTLGSPHRDAAGHVDNVILLLHGTGGERHTLLVPQFSNELFGPGQPFDITKYFLILPDDIGHGDSSKPSDGLHMHFPQYTYDDMVRSQYLMLTEGLHVDHLRLILGTSMGCMQAFVWGETYPTFASALAPFACLPTAIAGRNRMMRYMIIENIKHDPAWHNGDYTTEPELGLRSAVELLLVMGSAPLQMQKAAPTREAAEKFVDNYLARSVPGTDANDLIYAVNASRDYNPKLKLPAITAPVLYINSADDYINPPELGIAERLAKQIPHCRFLLIPVSDATRGHGTHTQAAVWKRDLIRFMGETEPRH